MPHILAQVPDAVFYVVGSNPAPEVAALARRNHVIVTGEVESLRTYYERCAVNVVPLMSGGGVIVKTLNGMAAARPTVTTPHGNAGVGAQHDRDIVVVEPDPEAFAAAVVRLLRDKSRWQLLAEEGRSYVNERYDWSTNVAHLADFLELISQDDAEKE